MEMAAAARRKNCNALKETAMKQQQPSIYHTLVLVTDQFACERIIKAARVIADLSKTNLLVLSVMRDGVCTNPAALELSLIHISPGRLYL